MQEYLINFRVEQTQEVMHASTPPEEYFLQSKMSERAQDNRSLTLKQMQYLWKEYLDIHNYPIGLYNLICKKSLTETIFSTQFNAGKDTFDDIGSSQLPVIQKFLRFWSETAIEDQNGYAELEIEEVGILFRNWIQLNQPKFNLQNNSNRKKKYNLKENKILDMLHYFHPDLEIVKDKYIMHRRNILWDKDMDIEFALSNLREDNKQTVSLYDSYLYYCKYFINKTISEDQTKHLLVSKYYFEQYVRFQYGSFLDDANDTFLSTWFETT